MRAAIAAADVGDDVLDGDPTTARLERAVAERLGTEAALFFPTGTMANQAAIAVLSRPGTEVYVHDDSHVLNWEMAGLAALAGVQPRVVTGAPTLTADTLRRAFRAPSKHAPEASLVCLEDTHNGAGGAVVPAAELAACATLARERGLAVHLDGARLWNASVATGTPLAGFARVADLTMVSFAKGLGCPVGAALAGSAALVARAHGVRKRLGGGMRQSGILAAGCLFALEHHLAGLATDHATAWALADRLARVPGVRVVPPDTNIVMVDLRPGQDSGAVVAAAHARGVLIGAWNATRVRAVTHRDVSASDVAAAAEVLAEVFGA
jgi:threonine aldolase